MGGRITELEFGGWKFNLEPTITVLDCLPFLGKNLAKGEHEEWEKLVPEKKYPFSCVAT